MTSIANLPTRRDVLLFASVLALAATAACSDASTDSSRQSNRSTRVSTEGMTDGGPVNVAELMSVQALPDVVIGRDDASVTIVGYASMTCGHCAEFDESAFPILKRDYLDMGKAKLILREFLFDPQALAAFMLARCAPGPTGRTAMVGALYSRREWVLADNAAEQLLVFAMAAGMPPEAFKACLADGELQSKAFAVRDRAAKAYCVDATPTFFVKACRWHW